MSANRANFTPDAIVRDGEARVCMDQRIIHQDREYLMRTATGFSIGKTGPEGDGVLTIIMWRSGDDIALAVPLSPDDAESFAQHLLANVARLRENAAAQASAALNRAAGK